MAEKGNPGGGAGGDSGAQTGLVGSGPGIKPAAGKGIPSPPLSPKELKQLQELCIQNYGPVNADEAYKEIMNMDPYMQRQEYNSLKRKLGAL